MSNCPQDILITREVGVGDGTVTWMEPTGSDDGGGEVTVLRSHVPGSVFPEGDTLVNYTFLDEAGNGNSCTFVISVIEGEGLLITFDLYFAVNLCYFKEVSACVRDTGNL